LIVPDCGGIPMLGLGCPEAKQNERNAERITAAARSTCEVDTQQIPQIQETVIIGKVQVPATHLKGLSVLVCNTGGMKAFDHRDLN
jgi:hypothetical protein